jgi:hypothetical protein
MPNGGSDCCGNCRHNDAVRQLGRPSPDDTERFFALAFCNLRSVTVPNPFWTYCRNFRRWGVDEGAIDADAATGAIYASGLHERAHVRIPWHGSYALRIGVATACVVCARQVEVGIEVDHEGRSIGFCTNRHYVEWWSSLHGSTEIDARRYAPPEVVFGEGEP